jgi:hypothetical protein
MKANISIFLSYAREDKKRVEEIYQRLSDLGFQPWIDTRNILPGEKWESSIEKAIRGADIFLACLSENSVSKRGLVQKEIRIALDISQKMLEEDIYLIPARLDDKCKVMENLHAYQWIDLFDENGWTRLVEAIQMGIRRRKESAKQIQDQNDTSKLSIKPDQGTTILQRGVKFYRGAGIGSYWYANDARVTGFISQSPGAPVSIDSLINFVAKGKTVTSPFISLTRSYAIARSYALSVGVRRATETNPAYVYEIELSNPLPSGVNLLDPIKEVAHILPSPLDHVSYQHDGDHNYLLGIISPVLSQRFLKSHSPLSKNIPMNPSNPSVYLLTLMIALRDAEILALGVIPAFCVVARHCVYY